MMRKKADFRSEDRYKILRHYDDISNIREELWLYRLTG